MVMELQVVSEGGGWGHDGHGWKREKNEPNIENDVERCYTTTQVKKAMMWKVSIDMQVARSQK